MRVGLRRWCLGVNYKVPYVLRCFGKPLKDFKHVKCYSLDSILESLLWNVYG